MAGLVTPEWIRRWRRGNQLVDPRKQIERAGERARRCSPTTQPAREPAVLTAEHPYRQLDDAIGSHDTDAAP